MSDERLYTRKEVAYLLSISLSTLAKLNIPFQKYGGKAGKVRYKISDINKYIEEHTIHAIPRKD